MFLGEATEARTHFEQGIALYDPQQCSSLALSYGFDPGVMCLAYLAVTLWFLGFPEQTLQRSRTALTWAHTMSHPFTLAFTRSFAAVVHQLRQEVQETHTQAEAAITLCTEQGFAFYLATGTILWGWALTEQGDEERGMAQSHQGFATLQTTGTDEPETLVAATGEARRRPRAGGRSLWVVH